MFLNDKELITNHLAKYKISPHFYSCGEEISLEHDLTDEEMDDIIKSDLLDFFYSICKKSGSNFRDLIIDYRVILVCK